MEPKEIYNKFDKIVTWRRGGRRAPHKPLLILLALVECVQKGSRYISFSEVDEKLKELLVEFGPSSKSYHPEYPFWRLQNDGIWELTNSQGIATRKGNTDAKKTELLKHGVKGGFNSEIHEFLASNPKEIINIANSILECHFPSSIHDDILQAIGLEIDLGHHIKRKPRDPGFRDRVLTAYEYQCAICGFNVRVGNALVALEAAHIKWHQAGGPDLEKNGIALCSLHHKLFDRGALSVSDTMSILVSDRAHGTNGFDEWLMAFHGKKLKPPQHTAYSPGTQFINWHVREVFQGQYRCL